MQRRLDMRKCYANRPEDPEALVPGLFQGAELNGKPIAFVAPQPAAKRNVKLPSVPAWPFDAAEAVRRQKALKLPANLKLDLASGLSIDLVLVPAGEFVMGSASGADDEYPPARVRVDHPFYMSRTEITNAQFAAFDARHDSAVISMTAKDQDFRGEPVNQPEQPVVRVSWQQAMAFCRWASSRTGHRADLPTEAQWEWAARAGTDTATYYGNVDTDFGRFANLADGTLARLARGDSPRWHPRIESVNDGATVTTQVARYKPNAWGLHDMIGNAAEWTRSAYRPYPYDARDGRNDPAAAGTKAVRGGSWYDRPYRATASFRMHYQPWQPVFDVGFRVIVEMDDQVAGK
jgi:formylglycine-generating enzyme required for sulfatase activity